MFLRAWCGSSLLRTWTARGERWLQQQGNIVPQHLSYASPGCRDGGPGHLCGVMAARLPQAVSRASAHLLRLESLQLGCCCHLLCWERVFCLPPPLVDLLSPGLGRRVGNPRASSAECLPRRRCSQQTRRQTEVPFPRGPLERSLQQDLGAGRLSTTCPSPRLMAAFAPRILLPISPPRG